MLATEITILLHKMIYLLNLCGDTTVRIYCDFYLVVLHILCNQRLATLTYNNQANNYPIIMLSRPDA